MTHMVDAFCCADSAKTNKPNTHDLAFLSPYLFFTLLVDPLAPLNAFGLLDIHFAMKLSIDCISVSLGLEGTFG